MSCCGSQRVQYSMARPAEVRQEPPAVRFEYVGSTGLSAVGLVTGKRYRFDGPGSRVLVDPRDVPSLAAVPRLRRI